MRRTGIFLAVVSVLLLAVPVAATSMCCGFLSELGLTGGFYGEYLGSSRMPTEVVFLPPETDVFGIGFISRYNPSRF